MNSERSSMTHRTYLVALLGIALLLSAAGCEKAASWDWPDWGRKTDEAEGGIAESPAPADGSARPGAGAAAAGAAATGEEGIVTRLDNGLRVIVRERHLGGMAAFRVYIGAGSLNEGRYMGAGVSHFLEHLVSGGTTANRSEADIREALQAVGAQTNAHTSKQFQCFHGQVAGEHIDTLIEVVGDYVTGAAIPQQEFDREREVIQREIERALADPRRRLWYLADETLFTHHPARHPVLGHLDAFRSLTRDDLVAFYRETFVPDNAVVVAVGDFDGRAVLEAIRRTFGGWERRPFQPTVLPDRHEQTGPRQGEAGMDVESVRSILEFPSIPLTHPDLYPLDILAFILGEGRASRLVSDLRERRGLVQSISVASYTPAGYDGGRFAVILECEPSKADAARRAVLEHLQTARDALPVDDELARAKRQKIAEHVFGLQRCEDIAEDVGLNALLVGDPDFSDRYVRSIQEVTAEDVRRVARTYLDPDRLCVSSVVPQARAAREAEAEDAKTAETTAGRPEIVARTLSNGVRLLLCPIPDHPTVSIQMVMRGGLAVESAETAGMSRFLARMLMKGTEDRSAEEIARTLDAMGAHMSASSGRNTIYLSARCLADDFTKTFDLAAECLLRPALPKVQIERLRAMTLAQLAHLADTPHGEASLYFNRTFFKDSPYRFPALGEQDVIRDLARKDLIAWHRKYVSAGNLVVAVFGGIDLPSAARHVADAVEDLQPRPDLTFPRDVPPRRTDGREVYIKGTQKDSAIVYVAYPGTDVYNVRDRFALDVLDTVVSGYRMPSGWLHEELRGKGLVYEVHAWSLAGLRPGYVTAMAVCQPQKVPEVVGIIETAMARARKETYTPAQLKPARATVITAKELGRETVDGWAFEAAIDEVLGLGYGFAREELQRIRQVAPGDVARVARQYLTQPVIVVVTGDPTAAEAVREK
jgi:zinc protease